MVPLGRAWEALVCSRPVQAPSDVPKPASPEFHQQMVAPSSDVDELGHVSNIAYVRWIQEVAKAHSAAVGLDHAAYVRLGAVFVVRRHDIEYLAPAYGGDAIRLTTWIAKWGAATSERRTRIDDRITSTSI